MSALNIENTPELVAYLQALGMLDSTEDPQCTALPGGVSSITILVTDRHGPDFIVKQARDKLAVREPWFAHPDRIHVEAAALKMLPQIAPGRAIPELHHDDRQNHLIIMAAVPQPHENWKTQLLNGLVDFQCVEEFAHLLSLIHRRTYLQEHYARSFANRSFFESLRLDPYYRFTASQVPQASDFLVNLVDATREVQACLVHGDYSPKNVLIYQDHIVLLDYEVAHYGDGTFDIGFAMTHFLSKAAHLPACSDTFIAAAKLFWRVYGAGFEVNDDWEMRAVQHTLGCLLARARGKSPLEYLSQAERLKQVDRCLVILEIAPVSMDEMIDAWETQLREQN